MRLLSVAHFGCESEKRWTSFPNKWHVSSFLLSVRCLILQNLEQNMDFTKINLVPRGLLKFDTIFFFLDLYDADIAKFRTGHGFCKGNFSPKGLIEIRHHFCIPIWPQLRHLYFHKLWWFHFDLFHHCPSHSDELHVSGESRQRYSELSWSHRRLEFLQTCVCIKNSSGAEELLSHSDGDFGSFIDALRSFSVI